MKSQHIHGKLICDFLSSWCWFTRSLVLVPTNHKTFFALITKNLTGASAQIEQWYRRIGFKLLCEPLIKFFPVFFTRFSVPLNYVKLALAAREAAIRGYRCWELFDCCESSNWFASCLTSGGNYLSCCAPWTMLRSSFRFWFYSFSYSGELFVLSILPKISFVSLCQLHWFIFSPTSNKWWKDFELI